MLAIQHRYVPFFMWLFPLFFFAYQFILRLWPGLMMHQIMEQFSIDATDFGLIAAFYYYGYAGMQIPVALLLERFGPRYIIFIFAVLCGIATLIFTYSNNFYLALLSRFLVGAGSAVGFLGVSKVLAEWFPQEQYARMIGFSFTFGLMGAIYGGKPVSMLLEVYNWQNIASIFAIISMITGFATYFILRSPKKLKSLVKEDQFKIRDYKSILTSPLIWSLAIANLLMVGSLEGFADVWGVQYLMKAHDLNKGQAAGFISFIFFGMLFGGPLLALFSKKVENYVIIALCGFGMAFIFIILLATNIYNPLLLSCLFFIVGIMCCYQVIVFAAGSNLVAPQNLGITVAFLNCINMLGGSFFHTIIGRIMDKFWAGDLSDDSIRIYSLNSYKYALTIIPICSCFGAIIILFLWLFIRRRYPAKSSLG